MQDQKNTILALVLSLIVLVTWQYFVGIPQVEKQRQEAQQKTQQQQAQPPGQPGAAQQPTAPAGSAPAAPPQAGAPTPSLPLPGQAQQRETALATAPRIRIETPKLAGTIALKGGRIDDLSLTQYRETVDPKSPAIVLLSPSGSPHPFYA
jgi:YidC/Oxa1 family membrane protein insertase